MTQYRKRIQILKHGIFIIKLQVFFSWKISFCIIVYLCNVLWLSMRKSWYVWDALVCLGSSRWQGSSLVLGSLIYSFRYNFKFFVKQWRHSFFKLLAMLDYSSCNRAWKIRFYKDRLLPLPQRLKPFREKEYITLL